MWEDVESGLFFPKKSLNSQSGGGPLPKSFLNKPCYMIVAKHRFECFSQRICRTLLARTPFHMSRGFTVAE